MAARLTAYLVVAIVAATVIAGLIVGAQRDDTDGPVDVIVHNASVYTADADGNTAEAVAIRGNQILSVGTNREIARLQKPQTLMIDAHGGTVLPGFNDSSIDLIKGGLGLAKLDLAGASTPTELLDRVAAWGAANPASPWIVGRGWSPELFTKAHPPRQVLDQVIGNRPVALYGPGDDSVWVNSKALELSQINRKTTDPSGGVIVRDPRRGEPTGMLQGSAVQLIDKVLPPPTRDERIAAILAAAAEANAFGITSVQTTGDTPDSLALYDEARREAGLTLRIYSALEVAAPLADPDLAALEDVRNRYPDDPQLKSGALFIRVDGEIPARTAAMLEPYEDDPESAAGPFGLDELNRTARLADAAGWQLVLHADGDRAAQMALTAIAHAVRSNRPGSAGRRHRIDGLMLVDQADLPRFGPLGAVASMQPARATPTAERMGLVARLLGEDRAARTFAFGTLNEQTRLLFGSAWPAEELNPLIGLHVAVNQQTPEGTPTRAWHAGERLKMSEAVTAYTANGAWASFDEHRKGTITTGMLADLVVLDRDIFEQPERELASATVTVTIFDGKVVYRRVPRTEPAPVVSLQH